MFAVSLLFFASLWGCKPEVVHPPYPPIDTTSHVPAIDTSYFAPAWQKPIVPTKAQATVWNPVLCSDGNILFRRMFQGADSVLRLYDGATGKLVWSWQHPDIRDGSDIGGNAIIYTNNRVLVGAWHKVFSIDATTGQTQWYTNARLNHPNANGNPRMWLQGNMLYHSLYSPGAPFCDSTFLVRTSVAAGRWDTLLALSNPKTYPSIESLTSYVDAQGDTILFFQNRQMLRSNTYPRMDVLAFNLRTRSIVWQQDSIDGNSTVMPALVHEGKVYFMGNQTLSCFDAATGNPLWKKVFASNGESFTKSNLLISDEKLIVKPDNGNLYALDKITGAELWKNTQSGFSPNELYLYHGYILFTASGDNGIWVHRLSDGKLMHRFQSPNKAAHSDAYITTGLAIDAQRGLLFTSDDYYMMCLRMKF